MAHGTHVSPLLGRLAANTSIAPGLRQPAGQLPVNSTAAQYWEGSLGRVMLAVLPRGTILLMMPVAEK